MRKVVTTTTMCVLTMFLFLTTAFCRTTESDRSLSTMERVIVFTIQEEIQASNLSDRRDLCVGFGHGLVVNEKTILSDLAGKGTHVHKSDWCNGRGISVSVLSPVKQISLSDYQLEVQAGDMTMRSGAHFATLLRRGTFVVHCPEDGEPRLLSYHQTCCAKANQP